VPNRETWRKRILEKLGDDGVDVELTEAQLDAALNRALELWGEYKPFVKWFPFVIPSAETVIIDFFAEEEQTDSRRHPVTNVRNVLNVRFQDADRRDRLGLGGVRSGSAEGYRLRWGSAGPRLFFQLHTAERRYERLTGSRPDWWWEPEERKLYISSPTRDTRIMVLASRPKMLGEIPYYDERKFLTAATAKAKEMLARVLGSMGDIPGPAGPIQTDHSELRSEAKEEWKEIHDQLATSLASVPPPTWVG
jgi:hypothetical protein